MATYIRVVIMDNGKNKKASEDQEEGLRSVYSWRSDLGQMIVLLCLSFLVRKVGRAVSFYSLPREL